MSDAMPVVCILAGGLGTRLGAQTQTTPKPLIEVAGEPFLIHQLRLLHRHGVARAVLCVGHLGEQIEERLGRSAEGVHLSYSYDQPGLDGTLGAIRRAAALFEDRFLVLYGDTYLPIDYRAAVEAWTASGLPALMTVLENAGRWGDSNARYANGVIEAYDKFAPTPDMRWIDYGLGGLQVSLLDRVADDVTDLAYLYSELAAARLLAGYPASERFHEIGTPDALKETAMYLRRHAPAEFGILAYPTSETEHGGDQTEQ